MRTRNAVQRLIALQVPGMAVLTSQIDHAATDLLPAAGIASVYLDLGRVDRNLSNIEVDYQQGIVAGKEHLVLLGHRRIGYIGGPAVVLLPCATRNLR